MWERAKRFLRLDSQAEFLYCPNKDFLRQLAEPILTVLSFLTLGIWIILYLSKLNKIFIHFLVCFLQLGHGNRGQTAALRVFHIAGLQKHYTGFLEFSSVGGTIVENETKAVGFADSLGKRNILK